MNKILGILFIILLVGCGGKHNNTSKGVSPTETPTPQEPTIQEPQSEGKPLQYKNVILFNDSRDPNNDLDLAIALALNNQGYIRLLAYIQSSTDLRNSSTMAVSAQAYYYRYPTLPIGLNPHKNKMRKVDVWSGMQTPPMSSVYKGGYKNIREFDGDKLHDNIGEGVREDSTKLLCRLLTDLPDGEKVSFVTGDASYNVYELLKEKTYCDGRKLIGEKVDMLTLTTGRSGSVIYGQSKLGGLNDKYALESLHYVINNLPKNVKLVLADFQEKNYNKIEHSKIGTMFKHYHKDSPLAFIYGIKDAYGVGLIKGHTILDSMGTIYAVFGDILPNGKRIGRSRKIQLTNTAEGAKIEYTSEKSSQIERFRLDGYLYYQNMKEWLEELLRNEIK